MTRSRSDVVLPVVSIYSVVSGLFLGMGCRGKGGLALLIL
jgi:hypothetical protein